MGFRWLALGILAQSLLGLPLHADDKNKPSPPPSNAAGSSRNTSDSAESMAMQLHNKRMEKFASDLKDKEMELRDLVQSKDKLVKTIAELKDRKRELLDIQQTMAEWQATTFIMASERTVTGVHVGDNDRYRLQAKRSFNDCEVVNKVAHKFGIPVVRNNDPRFESAVATLERDSEFPMAAVEAIKKHWKIQVYLPLDPNSDSRYFVCKDKELGKSRVGLMQKIDGRDLHFVSASGKKEILKSQQIEPGTLRAGTLEELLDHPEADFLDIVAIEIGKSLSSKDGAPSIHCLSISAKVDELEEVLNLSKKSDNSRSDRIFEALSRLSGQAFVVDTRKQETRSLRRFAMSFHDALSERLVKLGIPVANREDLEAIVEERERSETKHFDKRKYGLLASATHMVTFSIARPEEGGLFRVSLRLNDVHSGRILSEYFSDIGKLSKSYATMYMPRNGALGLLSEKAKAAGKNLPSQPLKLAAIDNQEFQPRIVQYAKVGTEKRVYDLFGRGYTPFEDRLEITQIKKLDDVPDHELFRFLTNTIAERVLPRAGRVRAVSTDTVEFNIGSNDGVTPGSLFRVVRLDRSYQDTEQIIPIQLKADTVSAESTVAMIVRDELSELWGESSIHLDDMVHLLGASNSTIRFSSWETSMVLTPKEEAARANRALRNGAQRRRLETTAEQMSRQMISRLSAGLQQVGIGKNEDDPNMATHVVSGVISPMVASPDCSRFRVQMHVTSPTSPNGIPIGPFTITAKQASGW